jgi:hypothetical protein
MSSHFHSGTLKWCKFPVVLKWPALTVRQVLHSATYFGNFPLHPCPPEFHLQVLYILFVPGWIEYLEQWASSIILRRSSKSFGTTKRFLNHRTPSMSSWKHFTLPNLNLLWMCPIPTSIFWTSMTSSLMVGTRAILNYVPCGTTRRLSSSRSQHGVRAWIMRWLQWWLWLNASAMTLAFPGW